MILSILIPTLRCRAALRRRLLDVLEPQVINRPGVELLIDEDDGERRIGSKRNDLVARASGRFLCFVDDDDTVSPLYVGRLMAGCDQPRSCRYEPDPKREGRMLAISCERPPDCVGFKVRRYSNSDDIGEAVHSLRHEVYSTDKFAPSRVCYCRTPNHLNPIRAELVRQVPFPELNHGEDQMFAARVKPLLQSEVFVDEYLYDYWYRTPYRRRDEVTNESRHADPVIA